MAPQIAGSARPTQAVIAGQDRVLASSTETAQLVEPAVVRLRRPASSLQVEHRMANEILVIAPPMAGDVGPWQFLFKRSDARSEPHHAGPLCRGFSEGLSIRTDNRSLRFQMITTPNCRYSGDRRYLWRYT